MKTAGLLDPVRDETTGVTRWRIGELAVCDSRPDGDLVTRELGQQFRRAREQSEADLEVERNAVLAFSLPYPQARGHYLGQCRRRITNNCTIQLHNDMLLSVHL